VLVRDDGQIQERGAIVSLLFERSFKAVGRRCCLSAPEQGQAQPVERFRVLPLQPKCLTEAFLRSV